MPDDGWELQIKEIHGEISVGSELSAIVDDGTHDLDHITVQVEEIFPDGLIKGKTNFFGSWGDCLIRGQWMTAVPPF